MVESLRQRRRQAALLLTLPAIAIVGWLVAWPLLTSLWPLGDLVLPPRAVDAVAPTASAAFDAAWLSALWAQLAYSALVLLIEVPLGVLLALSLPRRGVLAGLAVACVAWPLAAPQSIADWLRLELVPRAVDALSGWWASPSGGPCELSPLLAEWTGYVLVDVWRFTPFVALVCAFALRRDDELTVAAGIDGLSGWQRMRHVHWPCMRGACGFAMVIRLVDSFAAWPHAGSTVSLAAWVRDRGSGGFSATTAVATVLTLLVLALIPAWPLRAPSGGRR